MCHLIISRPSALMFHAVKGFLSVAKSTKCDLCLNSSSACSHSLPNKTPKSHIWNGFVSRRKEEFQFRPACARLQEVVEQSPIQRHSWIITLTRKQKTLLLHFDLITLEKYESVVNSIRHTTAAAVTSWRWKSMSRNVCVCGVYLLCCTNR